MSRNMPEYRGVVAFLDALGTKSITKEEVSETFEKWDTFLKDFDAYLEVEKSKRDEGQEDIELKKYAFSDSLIVTARHPDNRIDSKLLLFISANLNAIMVKSIEKRLFFRGALGMGTFFVG